ncbi:hypothetical protein os1_40880 [Comamonadaceae bacterium OS-1]|nr:hypothetical protein os1_40880 [Comamonadaceae bacterium OS-1]
MDIYQNIKSRFTPEWRNTWRTINNPLDYYFFAPVRQAEPRGAGAILDLYFVTYW